MESIIEHTKLVTRLLSDKLNLRFIKEFSMQQLNDCCERIENSSILEKEEQELIIQKELIRNIKFIEYFEEICVNNLENNGLDFLIEDIEKHNEKITDYPIQNIIPILKSDDLKFDASYAYLKYFSNCDKLFKKKVINNLNNFYRQDTLKIEELNKEMLKLFEYDYLKNSYLLPINHLREVYPLLIKSEKLRNIIWFMDCKHYNIELSIDDILTINNDADRIYIMIQFLTSTIANDNIMLKLLKQWKNNSCQLYDLQIIKNKINTIDKTRLESIFENRSSYINFIYGNRLKKFQLDNINETRENLIIYAIVNNKKSFLRLIDEYTEDFLELSTNNCILFEENFYSKYFNINELTLPKLRKIKSLYNFYSIENLKEQFYTFEEIEILSKVGKNYIELYNQLLDLKIDDRLLRIKQCIKKGLLDDVQTEDIEKIAKRIKEKAIYSWLEEFKYIKDIQPQDLIDIFVNHEMIKKFIREIKSRNELAYILRNANEVDAYENLENIRRDIIKVDQYWNYLRNELNFDDIFIQKYENNIKEFIFSGNAEIAYLYYISSNTKTRKSYGLIIKSEIMGRFKKLKYHTDDLMEEISFELNQSQIEEWTNNSAISEGVYEVKEYDDFYHTMILGDKPQRTCLNYKSGMYNKCLLACFDSNKKILYAKINDRIVGRAMIRLTKGTYSRMENKNTLSFFDVEKDDVPKNNELHEKLTLFLEHSYVAGISDTEKREVEKMFIRLMEQKARKLNAELVLSEDYYKAIDKNYVQTNYYVYISKSKASSQYLDSLGGNASVSDEGQYKGSIFYIWKPNKECCSSFLESKLAV